MALWRSPDLVRGGDSVLTEHGEEYASALAEWVDKEVMGRWDGSTDRNVPYDGIYPYEINMEYLTDELYSPDIYKWIICSSIYIYISPWTNWGFMIFLWGYDGFTGPGDMNGYEWIWIMDWLWIGYGIWMHMTDWNFWWDMMRCISPTWFGCVWKWGVHSNWSGVLIGKNTGDSTNGGCRDKPIHWA